MEYGKDKATNLVEAARLMLRDAGFIDGSHDLIFARNVVQGVLELARIFQEQRLSVLAGRLVVALFSRIARGSFPNPEFLNTVWREIEDVAKDEPYDEQEEKARWIQRRYPSIWWAGDLHDHIKSMTHPRISPNEKRSETEFAGAPLHRGGPEEERVTNPRPLDGYGLLVHETPFADGYMMPGKFSGSFGAENVEIFPRTLPLLGDMPPPINPTDLETQFQRFHVKLPGNLAEDKLKQNEETKVDAKTKTIETIKGYCKDMVSFTSLDISNKVKADGFTVRHREIAEFVREAFADGEMDACGYDRDLISVTIPGGKSAQAYLYHHSTVSADSYIDRAQTAAKPPVQVASPAADRPVPPVSSCYPVLPPPIPVLAPSLPAPPVAVAVPQAVPRLTRVLNTSSVIRTQKGDGRLEVPQRWVAILGWQVGDTVDAVRDGNSLILKTNTQLGEAVLRKFTVDRWRRIRITTKVLNQIGIHLGTGGQHVATLRATDIKIE